MPVEVAFAARRNLADLAGGKLLVTPRFAVTVVSGMFRAVHHHVPETTARQGAGSRLSTLPARAARVVMRVVRPPGRHSGTQASMVSKRVERRTSPC